MRALVVANQGDDDSGYVGEQLRYRGFDLTIGYRDEIGALPSNLDGYDLLVMLGSDWSVYWEHVLDQVDAESALVREAAVRDVPVLGICYGAQLMAHALGGKVHEAPVTEIGWFTLDSSDPVLAPPGPWFEFHADSFVAPPGADVLATTTAGPQAFRLGRMLAWQFHPEVSPDIVRRWGAGSRDQADRAGVDLEALYARTDRECLTSQPRCHGIVGAFLDDVAKLT